ncbi:MAG: thioredoxin-like domain-containing protein [Phycisphaerales bacterium JB047]
MSHVSIVSYARIAVALVLSIAPAAIAQSAEEVLEASRQAIAELQGFDAQFKMTGEGGSLFAETMPSMSGKLFYGTNSDLGRVIRVIGEGKDKQTEPSKPLDMLIASDRYIWVDRAEQVINEVPRGKTTRGTPSNLTFIFIDTMLNDDAYAQDTNDAQSISLGIAEEVGGVLCDQIVIKRSEAAARSRNTAENYTDVIWWIGLDDKLPRRVDRITDAGMVKITLSFEMTNLKTKAPEAKWLDVNRPSGFRFNSRMPGQEPKAAPNKPGKDEQGSISLPRDDQPTRPSKPLAPTFGFSTSDGAQINNSSQLDRVTMLYFWGSWCAPCAQTSPLIESLATEIDDPTFDVFALAIREGNPQAAKNNFERSYPTPRVSVNPEGMTSAFKVRVFPSIVVLDHNGSIVFQRGIERDFGAEELVSAAREAVHTALNPT